MRWPALLRWPAFLRWPKLQHGKLHYGSTAFLGVWVAFGILDLDRIDSPAFWLITIVVVGVVLRKARRPEPPNGDAQPSADGGS